MNCICCRFLCGGGNPLKVSCWKLLKIDIQLSASASTAIAKPWNNNHVCGYCRIHHMFEYLTTTTRIHGAGSYFPSLWWDCQNSWHIQSWDSWRLLCCGGQGSRTMPRSCHCHVMVCVRLFEVVWWSGARIRIDAATRHKWVGSPCQHAQWAHYSRGVTWRPCPIAVVWQHHEYDCSCSNLNKTKHPIHLCLHFWIHQLWGVADDGAMGAVAACGGVNVAAAACCFHLMDM